MPFFTIIIPLYNKENYVENTLKSIIDQTFTDYEVLIVNDCSTDGSISKIKPYLTNNIRLIEHSQNNGLSATRNTGIKNASADYVTFLDADDLWKPTFLEKIKSLILNFPEAKLFATNYFEAYPNNLVIEPTTNLKKFDEDALITNYFEINLSQPIYCYSGFCVKKEIFEKIGYFDENITFGEDVDFNIRANYHYKLAYSKESLVSYLMYADNRMSHDIICNKTITNFDGYENLGNENPSLKKYLDFNRYVMAKHYKYEKDTVKFKKMIDGISKDSAISGLNKKQLLLLQAPYFILKLIKLIQCFFIKKGIRISTYG